MPMPIPRTRFHKFSNRGQIAVWENNLNRKWPFRQVLVNHMVEELQGITPAGENLQVVEFASGPGMVAWNLLHQIPEVSYIGLDFSDPFVDYAQRRLGRFGTRVRFIHTDLQQDKWLSELTAPVDAFVSLQSLHDLGSEEHLTRLYTEGFRLLSEGGKLVNADFVVPPYQPNEKDPGRLPVTRHFEILQGIGFKWVDLRARQDNFACFVASKN